jgi:magnesium transporter
MSSVTEQERRESRLELLREALETGTLRRVARMVNSLHPAEIGRLLESLPPGEREAVWDLVDPDLDGDVLLEVNEYPYWNRRAHPAPPCRPRRTLP